MSCDEAYHSALISEMPTDIVNKYSKILVYAFRRADVRLMNLYVLFMHLNECNI